MINGSNTFSSRESTNKKSATRAREGKQQKKLERKNEAGVGAKVKAIAFLSFGTI